MSERSSSARVSHSFPQGGCETLQQQRGCGAAADAAPGRGSGWRQGWGAGSKQQGAGSREQGARWMRGTTHGHTDTRAGGDPPNWLFAGPTGWIVGPALTQSLPPKVATLRALLAGTGGGQINSGAVNGLLRGRFPEAPASGSSRLGLPLVGDAAGRRVVSQLQASVRVGTLGVQDVQGCAGGVLNNPPASRSCPDD